MDIMNVVWSSLRLIVLLFGEKKTLQTFNDPVRCCFQLGDNDTQLQMNDYVALYLKTSQLHVLSAACHTAPKWPNMCHCRFNITQKVSDHNLFTLF